MADIYSRIEQVNLLRNQEIVAGDSSSQRKEKPAPESPNKKDQGSEPGKGK
jgi:hypothetical protein